VTVASDGSIHVHLAAGQHVEDADALVNYVARLLAGRAAPVLRCTAQDPPDVTTLHALARLSLLARRHGGTLHARPTGALVELLCGVGLGKLLDDPGGRRPATSPPAQR
jgi:hypothetical protein